MKKYTFPILIHASRERVWQVLWNDATYRLWTAIFHEGSHAVSDWQEGSKILFLGPDGVNGMSSRIARLIPNEHMSFEHLGEVKNGVEDFSGNWSGSFENYTLHAVASGTELVVELDSAEEHADYFSGAFPKALAVVKEMAECSKIVPFIWFDNQSEAAAAFYTTHFPGDEIRQIQRNEGMGALVEFTLAGQPFRAFDGGPHFKLNPSVSFYVTCESEAETDALWATLANGGKVLVPMAKFPWSEKYGWVEDRFGLTWQISWGKLSEVGYQKIIPFLSFSGNSRGKAESTLQLYSTIFKGFSLDGILKYGPESPEVAGLVQHAQFRLHGQIFMAMDDPMVTDFQFNEAFSLVVNCQHQEEVDGYWDQLTANGGAASRCGWLKDAAGVSWQIIPTELPALLSDPDAAKAQRVAAAMMKMDKIEVAKLLEAANGAG